MHVKTLEIRLCVRACCNKYALVARSRRVELRPGQWGEARWARWGGAAPCAALRCLSAGPAVSRRAAEQIAPREGIPSSSGRRQINVSQAALARRLTLFFQNRGRKIRGATRAVAGRYAGRPPRWDWPWVPAPPGSRCFRPPAPRRSAGSDPGTPGLNYCRRRPAAPRPSWLAY